MCEGSSESGYWVGRPTLNVDGLGSWTAYKGESSWAQEFFTLFPDCGLDGQPPSPTATVTQNKAFLLSHAYQVLCCRPGANILAVQRSNSHELLRLYSPHGLENFENGTTPMWLLIKLFSSLWAHHNRISCQKRHSEVLHKLPCTGTCRGENQSPAGSLHLKQLQLTADNTLI